VPGLSAQHANGEACSIHVPRILRLSTGMFTGSCHREFFAACQLFFSFLSDCIVLAQQAVFRQLIRCLIRHTIVVTGILLLSETQVDVVDVQALLGEHVCIDTWDIPCKLLRLPCANVDTDAHTM
jgi:hypothetical protein